MAALCRYRSRIAQKSGFSAAGPYDVANVSIGPYETYTNRPTAAQGFWHAAARLT
jgi:hypothetical protein